MSAALCGCGASLRRGLRYEGAADPRPVLVCWEGKDACLPASLKRRTPPRPLTGVAVCDHCLSSFETTSKYRAQRFCGHPCATSYRHNLRRAS